MARTKRHTGFGKWVGLEDGEQVAGPWTGPDAKDQAEAWVLEAPARPAGDKGKEYIDRMYSDLRKPIEDEMAEIKAVLASRRDEDEVNTILRQIEPILKAGKQGLRRERMRFILPAQATA